MLLILSVSSWFGLRNWLSDMGSIDGQFPNWNCLFKQMELINLELELKFAINILIQKIIYHLIFDTEIFVP